MSPMDEQSTHSDLASKATSATLTAGQWLRQARESAGMDLGLLSALTKVPVRQLEALEADQHDQLMGTAFVRSLTSTICRHLNVDPQSALDLLPRNDTRLGPEKDSLGEADVPPLGGLFHSRSSMPGKVFFAVVLLVLLGGGVMYWMTHAVEQTETEAAFSPPAQVVEPVSPVAPAVGSTSTQAQAVTAESVTVPVTITVPATQAPDSKAQ